MKTYTVIANNLANISHFETVLSFVYYLCEHSKEVTLYCSFQDSIGGNSVLSYDIFKKYLMPKNLTIWDKSEELLYNHPNIILCNFGFIVSNNIFKSKKYKNFYAFARMDEGSGSWQNFFTLLKIGMEEQRNYNKSTMIYLLKKLISFFIGKLTAKKIIHWRWYIHDKINQQFVNYLYKVYSTKQQIISLPSYPSQTWIILTGGFVESGYVSSTEYTQWLEQIITYIKPYAKHILLKAHPAEDLSKYESLKTQVEVITIKESIDSLMYNPKYHNYNVIGEYSTSLVTLNILYGINTYFVKSLVYRDITGDFKKMFDKYVKNLYEVEIK